MNSTVFICSTLHARISFGGSETILQQRSAIDAPSRLQKTAANADIWSAGLAR